jgi:ABC-type amino acid transport system permease subunit
MNNILLRILSVFFKILGSTCVVSAFYFPYRMLDNPRNASSLPELHFLILSGLFLIPVAVGIITFGVSFLIDIWIALRLTRREIREMKTTAKPEIP